METEDSDLRSSLSYLGVLCVSVVVFGVSSYFTTETQRTLRQLREEPFYSSATSY